MFKYQLNYIFYILFITRLSFSQLPDDNGEDNELEFTSTDTDQFDFYEQLIDDDDWKRTTSSAPVFRSNIKKDLFEGQYNILMKNSGFRRDNFDLLISSLEEEQKVVQIFESPIINGFTAKLTKNDVNKLRRDPMVKIIEVDSRIYEFSSPITCKSSVSTFSNDSSWAVERISNRDIKNKKILVPQIAGKDVYIYIIDTGVKSDHQEFGGRVVKGESFIKDDKSTEDTRGHGTCSAGCAAGKTYGLAKDAYIVPVKVMDKDGRGANSNVIAGITWCLEDITKKRIKGIINMSLGGTKSAIVNNIINTVHSRGIPVIVAAGNSAKDAAAVSPASAAGAFTVGASDKNDKFADFSNKGKNVRINAPGVGITCPGIKSKTDTKKNSGTSFSSPYTAGVAAILYSHGVKSEKIYDEIVRLATKKSLKDVPKDTPNLLLYSGCNEKLKV